MGRSTKRKYTSKTAPDREERVRSPVSWTLEGGANISQDSWEGTGSCHPRKLGLKGRGKEARKIYKQQERQQRDKLNLAYDNLRAQLHAAAVAKRVSKQLVLNLATETSQAIQSEEVALKTQMCTLTKTNVLLKEKLEKLEAAQKSNKVSQHEMIA